MAVGALLTWLSIGLVMVGLGLPVGVRVVSCRAAAIRVAIWVGVAMLVLIVSILSLLAPLRSFMSLGIVLGLALFAAALSLSRFARLPWKKRRLSRPWMILFCGVLIVGAVVWSISVTRAPTNYDSGLYHLGAIEYAAQAGAVPGLANLFAPLGYGNAQIPVAAFLTNGPLGSQGFEALNSFLLLLLPIDLLLRSYSHARPRIGSLVLAAGIFTIYPPMLAMTDAWVISPTSDTAVLVFTLAAVSTLALTVRSGQLTTARVLLIITPLAVAGAMRPQAWLMFAAVLAVLVVVHFRLSPKQVHAGVPALLASALIPAGLIAAVGLARDAVLSGWWLYPVNRFPLPVEWRAADPSGLLTSTLGIARDPGPAYQQAAQGYDWLLPWALRLPQTWEFWLLIALMAAGVVLVIISLGQGNAKLKRLLLAAAPGVLASVVWLLLTPPSFRFGWGPLFSTAALLFGWGWVVNKWADRWISGLGGACILAVAVWTGASRLPAWPTSPPEVLTDQVPITEDLVIESPAQGDQCWRTFPLCTSAPAGGLQLLGPDWTSGFDRGAQPG